MARSPFIYWKEPGKKEIFTILKPRVKKIKEPLLYMEGFLFFPYKKTEQGYFIEGVIKQTTELNFPETIKKDQKIIYKNSENYISLVNKGIEKIKKGDFKKVVLARSFSQNLPDNFSLKLFFEKLCAIYNQAFVYCLRIENEIWIGASPEVFLKKENDLFLTYALAGTKSLSQDSEFGKKEAYEQQFVKNYIVEMLKKTGGSSIEISKVKELNTGNLKHLINEIKFKTTTPNELINKLHPTPAVCGTPFKTASVFIKENENFEREYYSGFLGPVFPNTDFSFWVNLRCAKIAEHLITFYAGAGIVKDSSAEDEWLETERKMDTLRSLL